MNYVYAADLTTGMVIIIPDLEGDIIVDIRITSAEVRPDGFVYISVAWDAAGDWHGAGTADYILNADQAVEVA